MEGKREELYNRIMPDGKAMILAYDQGFEHGPVLYHRIEAN